MPAQTIFWSLIASVTASCGGCQFSPNAMPPGPDADLFLDGSVVDARPDAPPDAPPVPVMLSETTSTAVSIGDSVQCDGAETSLDNAWYRAFRPADVGITGTLHVDAIDFASEISKGAAVVVTLYTYAGPYGGATLDETMFTQVATTSDDVADSNNPQDLAVALSADVPPGNLFVVEISSTDTQTMTGIKLTYFHLGANAVGESEPAYWSSATCGEPTPTGQTGFDAIIAVEGTH